MAIKKILNSEELSEFFSTYGAQKALADFCFDRSFLPRRSRLKIDEVYFPKECSITVSLGKEVTDYDLDTFISNNTSMARELNATTDSKRIKKIRELLLSETFLSELQFPYRMHKRIHKFFSKKEIKTAAGLVIFTIEELMKFRGVGVTFMTTLLSVLHKNDICLGMDTEKFLD